MIDYIKTFCQIPEQVTIYDDNLKQLRDEALGILTIAGASIDETNAIVKAYTSTYCRLHYQPDVTKTFDEVENRRLQEMINLLVFGG
ncbi:hypothetical protein [Lactococcus fujiensis]|uniref:Uncharacterized protein n=1 Tax=Lactococcus fujiensis JCM 16395 TaxID=1291764 RepID=A0A2A5RIE9_9LACT|nr:hypothetical protein [Lactococcus fujiensis]PCR98865.1 hypothetical protein RT41_GL000649 [Lactococcus fujiensis JCM 16395]